MTLRVQVSQQTEVELNVEPINQWATLATYRYPSLAYDRAQPINVGHVVFFVEELAAVETFYREVLGFPCPEPLHQPRRVSAACAGASQPVPASAAEPQARPEPRGLYRARYSRSDRRRDCDEQKTLEHVYRTSRHPVSSAYFWYVNSRLAGRFEYCHQ